MNNVPHNSAETRPISSVLKVFCDELSGAKGSMVSISVGDILYSLHERGFGIVLLFLSLPMALPVPVPPVLNVILALPLLFLTLQQMLGVHNVWLPKIICSKEIEIASVISVVDRIIPFLVKLELLTKPRLVFLTGALVQKMTGLFGTIMALSVCIPLPLTNTVPSLSIAIMALGVLMHDGLAVAAGAVIGSLWVAILIYVVLTFGPEGIDVVKDAIKSLF